MGPTGHEFIKQLCCSVLQIVGGMKEAKLSIGIFEPYMDLGLRKSRRKCCSLIARPYRHATVDPNEVHCYTGFLAVFKKGGKQRLIADCRLFNTLLFLLFTNNCQQRMVSLS